MATGWIDIGSHGNMRAFHDQHQVRFMVKVLFVCMGNICRSPTAEGVFRHKVELAGMGDRVEIDSAGGCLEVRMQRLGGGNKYGLQALG